MPSELKNFELGAGLGIPSEPCSSKVRLIVLLSIELHQVFTPNDKISLIFGLTKRLLSESDTSI